ncbi:dethiobiotin synthase [Thiohalorhabdus methylotrophus]|uniref:ATP-dependent dethiobiotin synthetase BioD n=1 Tax=Thiohalorhabdus methylotrophus TaxID=3242694 RepID=A0ABV4TS46_9GAMM
MNRTLVVTGTGTEIGKTYITAAVARQLRGRGETVLATKPVSSGCDEDAQGRLWSPDGRVLLDACGQDPDDWAAHQRLCLERLREPMSPHMAADRAGRILSLQMLTGYCQGLEGETDGCVIAEGVGGVMVPLTDSTTFLDWMAALQWPALLVTGTYLGTLSHTLTALQSLKGAGVPLAGLVLNRSPEEPVPAEETRRTLRFFHPELPMAVVPRAEGTGEEAGMPDLVETFGIGRGE